MTIADAFSVLRLALERAGVRYAVGGSWASTAFGEARFTNGVNFLADLTPETLGLLIAPLPKAFYADEEESRNALRGGSPFNVIYMPIAFKFDFFRARAFPLGAQGLDRALLLEGTGLSEAATPFVTPEDILLAKLHWYKLGGEVSDVQWRNIRGPVRGCGDRLDRAYLRQNAAKLGVVLQLEKAVKEE